MTVLIQIMFIKPHYYKYPIDREKTTLSYYGDLSDNLSIEAKFTQVDYYNDNDSLGGEDFGHHRIRLSSGEYAYLLEINMEVQTKLQLKMNKHLLKQHT